MEKLSIHDLEKLGKEFLQQHEGLHEAKVLFMIMLNGQNQWNSNASSFFYNGELEYIGCFASPLDKELGLWPSKDTLLSGPDKKPIIQMHEVKKFCKYLHKASPGFVETLFSERDNYQSNPWKELLKMRHIFLNEEFLQQLIGSAEFTLHFLQQDKLSKKSSRKIINERAYKVWAALIEAQNILTGKPLNLDFENDDRKVLSSIKNGDYSKDQLIQMIEPKLQQLVEKKLTCNLPKSVDSQVVNNWLLKVRLGQFPD